MERALGHSTALRTVGRMFDADQARAVVIEERMDSIWLSWDARSGQGKTARYPWVEVDRLARSDQLSRADQLSRTDSSFARLRQQHQDAFVWSELLRTLGQDLDEESAETSSITGDLSWLTASWVCGGRFVTRQYTAAELWNASRRRAASRQPVG